MALPRHFHGAIHVEHDDRPAVSGGVSNGVPNAPAPGEQKPERRVDPLRRLAAGEDHRLEPPTSIDRHLVLSLGRLAYAQGELLDLVRGFTARGFEGSGERRVNLLEGRAERRHLRVEPAGDLSDPLRLRDWRRFTASAPWIEQILVRDTERRGGSPLCGSARHENVRGMRIGIGAPKSGKSGRD